MTVESGTGAAVPARRRLPAARVLSDGAVIYWWGEIMLALGFYFVYSTVRNAKFGGTADAYRNARTLIDVQRFFGIDHEQWLQHLALHSKALIVGSNYFYGSLHFVVTIGVMVFLFVSWPDDYPFWRNTLAVATALALVGFTFWPLMPRASCPRRTATSTRWRATPRSGRSTPARSTRSPTSTRPCPASTAAGRCGARACSSRA